MTAARVVGSQELHARIDLTDVQQELSRLHIMLLTVKADVEDVLSPGRPPGSAVALKTGVKHAVACLDALRERLQEG